MYVPCHSVILSPNGPGVSYNAQTTRLPLPMEKMLRGLMDLDRDCCGNSVGCFEILRSYKPKTMHSPLLFLALLLTEVRVNMYIHTRERWLYNHGYTYQLGYIPWLVVAYPSASCAASHPCHGTEEPSRTEELPRCSRLGTSVAGGAMRSGNQ